MARCQECGASTVWNDDVGSQICQSCGTLLDASQSVLTSSSHNAPNCNNANLNPLWNVLNPSQTLKSYRSPGWNLAGQGKEVRDRNNMLAMHEFIRSIALRLSASGLTSRAIILFSQAMSAGKFYWGNRARLIAGASIAIALRESNRPDSLKEISFLLDTNPTSLNRAFRVVVELLKLNVVPATPAAHLNDVRLHLSTLLEGPDKLSKELSRKLNSLSLSTAFQTATDLSDLLLRQGDTNPISSLPTPPTACALTIHALEAEARESLPDLSNLALRLGERFGLRDSAVMSRYKLIEDFLEEQIRQVPWLEQYKQRTIRAGTKRSKVAKRAVVARGLKDVLLFQDNIRMKKLETESRPTVVLEGESDDCLGEKSEASSSTRSREDTQDGQDSKPRKRQRKNRTLDDASRFLLDPLCARLSFERSPRTTHPYATYLISAPVPSTSLTSLPTRLQLLAVSRGGGGKAEVDDNELFEEGELDDLVRGEEERESLRVLWGWEKDEETGKYVDKNEAIEGRGKERNKKAKQASQDGTNRIDMEAYCKLLHCGSENAFTDEEITLDLDLLGIEGIPATDDEDLGPTYDDGDRYDQEYD